MGAVQKARPPQGCLVGFCWALTPTTLPPRHEQPAAPAPAAGPRCAAPAGSARRGARAIEQPQPHPAAINPRRLELDADGERGSHGKPGGAAALRPHRGQPSPNPIRFSCPLHRGSASAATASISMANVRGKAGPPPGPPPRAAVPPHSTDTVPTCAACSLRATERAVSRGIRRGFCTGRPRRPMWTVTRGSDQALLLPG